MNGINLLKLWLRCTGVQASCFKRLANYKLRSVEPHEIIYVTRTQCKCSFTFTQNIATLIMGTREVMVRASHQLANFLFYSTPQDRQKCFLKKFGKKFILWHFPPGSTKSFKNFDFVRKTTNKIIMIYVYDSWESLSLGVVKNN